jgi:hypothetical protein
MSGSTNTNTEIEATPDGIAKYIVERAQQTWDETKSPLLLSSISPELKLRGVNYKEVVQGMTLRQFVGTLENLRIVVHPLQKAKIGVVPNDSTFVFEVKPTVRPATTGERSKKVRQPNQRYIVMQFLAALSRLSEDERKSVSIPIHILARLMEE